MKKNYLLIVLSLLFSIFTISAQESDELWSKTAISAKTTLKKTSKQNLPSKFDVYDLNLKLLKSKYV